MSVSYFYETGENTHFDGEIRQNVSILSQGYSKGTKILNTLVHTSLA